MANIGRNRQWIGQGPCPLSSVAFSEAGRLLSARPVQFEYEVWCQEPSRVANAPATELAKARHASERRTLHSRHEGLLHPAPVSRPLQGRLHRRERDDSRAPR